jgi:5-methyltetrahydropteroyltriglutamate--homocysteine methyltransferase
MLKTTIAGSLPKPPWLADSSVQLFAPWMVRPDRLREAQDDAVRLALADQEEAGIDIMTDGEQRRRHYIWGFLEGLTGTDTQTLRKKQTRGGRYLKEQDVARVVGEVTRPRPVMVEALRFAKAHTRRPVKVTLPGPMTIVDSVRDEYYRCGEAVEHAIEGVSCTTAIHICYSYGIPRVLAWKKQNTEWGQYAVTLPLLARTRINQLSVECAASGVDEAVLAEARGKDVLLGVIDVGTEEVESPELVATRIRKALPYVPPERLFPCTDCGLVPRSRQAARGKLKALAEGTSLVRSELDAAKR